MKAAQLVGRKLFEFIEVDIPTIQDGECLIKLERVSICGSDIRHGYGPRYPEEDYPLEVGRPAMSAPAWSSKARQTPSMWGSGSSSCPGRAWEA